MYFFIYRFYFKFYKIIVYPTKLQITNQTGVSYVILKNAIYSIFYIWVFSFLYLFYMSYK